MLDVGTNNEKLLADDFYMGLRHRRIDGQQYFDILDEFMSAVHARFPRALIQFEVMMASPPATRSRRPVGLLSATGRLAEPRLSLRAAGF
jgi:hypothetical protein